MGNGVVNLEERRLKAAVGQIAQVLQGLSLLEPAPALVTTPPPIAVGLEQGASLLGVSPDALEEQVRAGKLRTLRIGRRRLVRLDSLNAFAQAQEEAEVQQADNVSARWER